jgi:AcrR family transcriptional regulator
MDARQLRTRLVLAQAIVELAAARSLEDISVTDVATRAGVSRPTFYAHTDSPGALLGSVLAEELAQLPYTGDLTAFLVHAAEHVQHNRALYRNNVRLRLPLELRDPLLDHLERGLTAHLVRHPDLVPAMPTPAPALAAAAQDDTEPHQGDVPDDRSHDRQLFAAMAASCTVAAFENWLRSPDAATPERVVELTLLGIAEWWSEAAGAADGTAQG